jgi:hypothetical protein
VKLTLRLAATVTVWFEVVLTPTASVVVTETRKEPAAVKMCVVGFSVELLLSPKFQLKL